MQASRQSILLGSALLSFFLGSLEARQLVAPLLQLRRALSKPYIDVSRCPWSVSFWTTGYQRSACNAYNNQGCEVPLSTLFFLESNFLPTQVLGDFTKSPFLAQSNLGPRVSYKESGAVLGLDVQHYVNECYRVGLRASLPVGKIRVKRLANVGNGTSDLGGLRLSDFAGEKTEIVNGSPIKSFAYRLDFLSSLPFSCGNNCPGSNIPLVNYADTDFPPNNPITISNQDITNQQGTPVSALKSISGNLPTGSWALPQAQAQALTAFNDTGTNRGNNQRGRFDSGVSYSALGQNIPDQATLFIVPSVDGTNTTQEARVIQVHVNELIDCIGQEAEDLFKECGISFAGQCNTGVGDLDTEIYAGYFVSSCAYIEGYVGIRWPSGKKAENPQKVFDLPLGNNGHFEGKIGSQALYQTCRWAAIRGDITGSFVVRNKECVASSFRSRTIKNIGVPVQASVRWNYYLLHAELILTPPNWPSLLGTIGYELYHKGADNIRFCQKSAVDCLGNEQPLDACIIARNTRVVSHKVRGEVTFEPCEWLYLYGGASRVFAGSNTPKETEWHLGFSLYY